MIKAKVTLIEELENGKEVELVKDKIIFPVEEVALPQEHFSIDKSIFVFTHSKLVKEDKDNG